MSTTKETFQSLMTSFEFNFNRHTVFKDFLTMSLCALAFDPTIKKSRYEDDYLSAIEKYKHHDARFLFPKLFARLVMEMEERVDSSLGNDVLGDYFELHLGSKNKGQFFTPWPICTFMARSFGDLPNGLDRPLRVLDPSCGSGRMLLASAKAHGPQNEYFGIDIDSTCVEMAALNLFLNGIFSAEILCADALIPGDFRGGYVTSFMPLGIFRIEKKEDSVIWQINTQPEETKERATYEGEAKRPEGNEFTQLTFF